ncbi:HIT domain-containing protein [Candidatus Cytomitobacter indipagum]|uniref:HIT domain-containing protein n=1 Tax=Candidatus Cytomitobacter indipagum TaxID=2601575 RepID=A0A5C0UF89_9PROT|nr:HIT domain-containing protein [Candidatus Cytomitobacter indipagum]QEK38303.1 HIT domain-containing protein [Candidatus Cytomitobacter indipagum]
MNKYDTNNIFAKILRTEIPSDMLYEDEYAASFKDINPQAKIHALIIPKKEYQNISELLDGDKEFLSNFMKSVSKAIKKINVKNEDFQLIANNGENAGQEIFHMHFHLLID